MQLLNYECMLLILQCFCVILSFIFVFYAILRKKKNKRNLWDTTKTHFQKKGTKQKRKQKQKIANNEVS